MPCGPSLPEAHASGGENDGRGFDWRVLAALFLLALLVRIGSLWELSAVDPYFASPVVDEQTNLESALRIAGGKVRPDAPYWKPPLYPHLMALVVDPQRDDPGRLFGDEAFSPCRLKAIQAFIDSFTAVLVALLGGLAAGRAAGIAASILYSLAFSPVFFSAQLLDTTLFTFLAVLSLQQLVVAEREGSRLAWLWGGALLGLAADTRAVMLATIAAVALVAPIFLAGAPRRRLAYGALVVAGAALLILPVTLMNWRFGGDRVLISSNGGINFYIGNRRGDGYGADGLTSVHAGPRWRRLLELASDEDRASARSRRYYALAFEEIAADPAHFAGRILRKAHALLHGFEVPNNKNFVEERRRSWALSLLPGRTGVIFPLGITGLIFLWRRLRHRALLLTFLISQGGVVIAFFVAARYRVPLLAILCVPAGALIAAIIRRGLSPRRRRAALATLLGLLWILNVDPFGSAERFRDYVIDPLALGYAREQRGESEEAERLYLRALELDPDYPEAEHNLGHLARERGDLEEAEGRFRRALEVAPWFAEGWNSLGSLLLGRKRPAEAVGCFERARREDPTYAKPYANLGQLAEARGLHGDARDDYQEARRLAPERALYPLLEARVLIKMERGRAARALVEGVKERRLRLTPDEQKLLKELERRLAGGG